MTKKVFEHKMNILKLMVSKYGDDATVNRITATDNIYIIKEITNMSVDPNNAQRIITGFINCKGTAFGWTLGAIAEILSLDYRYKARHSL